MKIPSKAQIEEMGGGLEDMVRETAGLGPPRPEMLRDCGDGEVLPVLTYPNPRLRDESGEVEYDDTLRKLVADLAVTMYTVGGIGIAAPQIGTPARVFVIDLLNGHPVEPNQPRSQLLVAVNPQIWPLPDKTKRDAERCLSFPDVIEVIERPSRVIMKAFTHRGTPYAIACGADLARAIQHEFDHLEGRLLIDYVDKKTARRVMNHVPKKPRPKRRW